MDSEAIEVFETVAWMISGIDGGFSPAMTEEEAAAAKAGGYPSRFCQGIGMKPSAEASATAEPDTPPKTVEPTTETCPSPPG